MQRILAHNIIYQGNNHHLSVAEIADDGTITVRPFTEETSSTTFVNGTVDIDRLIQSSRRPDRQDESQLHIS